MCNMVHRTLYSLRNNYNTALLDDKQPSCLKLQRTVTKSDLVLHTYNVSSSGG